MKKISKNANNTVVDINLSAFDEEALPEDDVRRCAAKALTKYTIDTLPAFVASLDLKKIVPSPLSITICLLNLVTYYKTNKGAKHPSYYIDLVHQEYDSIISDEGIKYVKVNGADEEEVNLKSMMGMVTDDNFAFLCGAASTLVNYYTRETETDINATFNNPQYLGFVQIPNLNLITVRDSMRTYKNSVIVSRDSMYETMMNKNGQALVVIDRAYSVARKYSQVNNLVLTKLTEMKNEGKINFVPSGRVPVVCTPAITVNEQKLTYDSLWTTILVSRSLRGQEKGIGGLTAGYCMFDMPAHIAKAVYRARELLQMASNLGVKLIRLPSGDSDYPTLLVQILVANGMRVQTEAGSNNFCTDDSPPGVYRSSKVKGLQIISNPFREPTFSASGISMNQGDFEKGAVTFNGSFKKHLCATLVWFTRELEAFATENKYVLYPAFAPHTGKIWLCSHEIIKLEITPLQHRVRMLTACYCKNLFPLTRKPFVASDEYRHCFKPSIIFPKIIRKASKGISIPAFKASSITIDVNVPIDLSAYNFCLAKEIVVDKEANIIRTVFSELDGLHYEAKADYVLNQLVIDDPEVIKAIRAVAKIDKDVATILSGLEDDKSNALKKTKASKVKEKKEEKKKIHNDIVLKNGSDDDENDDLSSMFADQSASYVEVKIDEKKPKK